MDIFCSFKSKDLNKEVIVCHLYTRLYIFYDKHRSKRDTRKQGFMTANNFISLCSQKKTPIKFIAYTFFSLLRRVEFPNYYTPEINIE